MNKDLYIQLLEEHVDDLTTAAKIETVLTSRKNCLIKRLSAELTTMKDLGTAQDELLSKVADTALDCQDDLNDLQADWAESNVVAGTAMWAMAKEISDLKLKHIEQKEELRIGFKKQLEVIKEQNTRECDLNVRLQGIIKELTGKLDTADAGLRQVPMLREQVNEFVKKNENLQEDLETSRKRIAALEADKNGHRSIAKELKKEKYDMGVELEKLKKENAELGSQILDYKEDILNLQGQLGV